MALSGIPLSTYTEEPEYIPEGAEPIRTIERYEERVLEYFDTVRYDLPEDIFRECHSLPTEVMEQFSIVELMKVRAGSIIMLRSREINRRFDEVPEYRVFDKIANSMWRWGYGDFRDEWNTLVDAYNGIKNFSFGLPDFEVTLTHTTGHNECGRSEHDRELFLDGVFGFMVHYRGEHVMTVGFSFASGRKLFLTQVQMKKEKGNRFLFKLPTSGIEYALTLFAKHFPTFTTYIIEGESATRKYLGQYRNLLDNTLECQERSECRIAEHEKEMRAGKCFTNYELCSHGRELERRTELIRDIAWARARIHGLETEIGARIKATYDRHHGAWLRDVSDTIAINQLRFYRIVSA